MSPAIAVAAFVLGVITAVWAGSMFAPSGEDTRDYRALAFNVLDGHGLSLDRAAPYRASANRAPVYPLFLAAIYRVAGDSPRAVLVVQAILLGLAAVLISDVAAMLFGRRVALVTALLVCLNPYLGRVAGSVLTEALFTALVAATIWSLVRALCTARMRWFGLTGAVWAAATLCRPATVVALPLLALVTWIWSPKLNNRRMYVAAMFTCGMLAIAPWTIRNYVRLHAFIPLQTRAFGYNFWLTSLDRDEQPLVSWEGKTERWRQDHPELNSWYAARSSLELATAEQLLFHAALDRIKRDPWKYVKSHGRAIPHLWVHSGKLWLTNLSFGEALAARRYGAVAAKVALMVVLSLLPLAFASLGLWFARDRWRQIAPLLTMPAAIAAAYLPSWIEERYGLPAVPFFLVLAASAVVALADRWIGTPAAASSGTRTPDGDSADDICVIIPAKNEGAVLADVTRRALGHCHQIIVVDGHSTDGSVDALEAERIRVIHDTGRGKGDALRCGIDASAGTILVTMDADGSHDPTLIDSLVQPIRAGVADMVIGCRMRGGSDEFAGTWAMFVRLWGNNFLTQLINARFGTRLTDTQNGFRAARADLLRSLDLRENKHTIELEMVLKVLKRGGRIVQVPAHEYARRAGESSLSVVRQAPHFAACLLRNIW